MKLYGTTTSPFVRRVRVVALECGLAYERVDTATDVGQAALKQVSPIWKVPAAELDGRLIYDSRAIIEWLTTTRGWGGLTPPRDHFLTLNHTNAVDGLLESAVQIFYLRRDGVAVDGSPFAERQLGRIAALFGWLGGELDAGRMSGELGLAELSLICTLDWLDFRAVIPLDALPASITRLRAAHAERPSLRETRPHA
jgi:glutathione S-transferase